MLEFDLLFQSRNVPRDERYKEVELANGNSSGAFSLFSQGPTHLIYIKKRNERSQWIYVAAVST